MLALLLSRVVCICLLKLDLSWLSDKEGLRTKFSVCKHVSPEAVRVARNRLPHLSHRVGFFLRRNKRRRLEASDLVGDDVLNCSLEDFPFVLLWSFHLKIQLNWFSLLYTHLTSDPDRELDLAMTLRWCWISFLVSNFVSTLTWFFTVVMTRDFDPCVGLDLVVLFLRIVLVYERAVLSGWTLYCMFHTDGSSGRHGSCWCEFWAVTSSWTLHHTGCTDAVLPPGGSAGAWREPFCAGMFCYTGRSGDRCAICVLNVSHLCQILFMKFKNFYGFCFCFVFRFNTWVVDR